jgi:hypothetical protein
MYSLANRYNWWCMYACNCIETFIITNVKQRILLRSTSIIPLRFTTPYPGGSRCLLVTSLTLCGGSKTRTLRKLISTIRLDTFPDILVYYFNRMIHKQRLYFCSPIRRPVLSKVTQLRQSKSSILTRGLSTPNKK